jgi:hypothetical protein
MTEETLIACLDLLAGMPSAAPWSKAVSATYSLAMEGWTDDVAFETVRRSVLTEEWRPAPARLIAIAVELHAPMLPAFELREQIRQMLIFHGGRAAGRIAAKEFPLLNRVAEHLGGWANLTHMGTEEIDKGFPFAYNAVARDWAVTGGSDLLRVEASERRALLGASRGPGSVRTATLRIDGSAPARKEQMPLHLSQALPSWREEDDAA